MAIDGLFISASAWSTLLLALITSIIYLPASYNPLPLFRLLVGRLALRIYDKNASGKYQVVSSLVLTLLITGCFLMLSYALGNIAQFPIALELILLFIFIENPYFTGTVMRIKNLKKSV